MCKVLVKGYCTVYFDNFFNSRLLISKPFKKGIYDLGTTQSNKRVMPALPSEKKTKRGDSGYQFSTDVVCCKWMDNRYVEMLFNNIEGMQTKSLVQCRVKGSTAKVSVSCPDVIKLYNKGIDGVDLVDQRTAAYHLDRKSSIRFYLRIFFDLINIACANSYTAYALMIWIFWISR